MRCFEAANMANQGSAQQPPLIILCTPRSYSSVVCAMLGQHPELYGFPELSLFVADTVQGMLDFHHAHRNGIWTSADCSPGLLRCLAQLLWGAQTSQTIAHALAWVDARRHWTTQRVFDCLLGLVSPRIGVDKSPLTVLDREFLARAGRAYTHARYLHLTRHPIPTVASAQEQFGFRLQRMHPKWDAADLANHFAQIWCAAQEAILQFTRGLSPEQTLRVRGEDLLHSPNQHLKRIAGWMGLSAAPEIIEAMQHPERSHYAHFGPAPAQGANDPKFLKDPKLRRIEITEYADIPADWKLQRRLRKKLVELTVELGYETGAQSSLSDAALNRREIPHFCAASLG
jgi:hypothetical protein